MSMVEKVARAIYTQRIVRRSSGENWAYPEPAVPWEEHSNERFNERFKDLYREEARAAIEAMREPDAEMVGAMQDARNQQAMTVRDLAVMPWQAGIDAALGKEVS